MKLLVIGGTRFLGRHIVESALSRGHELTLFHRGQTNKGLFDVEEILGDRDGETDHLYGRTWDAVVDTCGYVPRVVEQSADTLAEAVGLYCFISTISVYRDGHPRMTEDAELLRFSEIPEKEEITGETYGPFKVLCEEAVANICGDEKTLLIRPGLIVGPHDPTDRFTYWIDRYGSDDEILIPERRGDLVQFVDVRDLADFTVRAVEDRLSGAYNATGPAERLTMGEFWDSCRTNCGGHPREVVVSDEFVQENELHEWSDLPLLLPAGDATLDVDCGKAIAKGLTFRPLPETIRDTADWHRSRGPISLKAGLSREREVELIAKWRSRPS
ncbi:MAG TPA: NAD-dependent epimerase/dehydratase family protein [Fimbriimonadaceae bacterium]|nr:NAD-dependent epimerase/dehydratase family protein [Fimbriimonadaceae bacterium]